MTVLDGPDAVSPQLVDAKRLAGFLAQSTPDLAASLPILAIERVGRGQSNLTFRVTFAGDSPRLEGGRTLILRRPPTGPLPPRAHDVLREARVMQALAGSAVPVPDILLCCADPEVLGAPFFLMEDVPGDAVRFTLPPAFDGRDGAGQEIGAQLVDALAALHSLDPSEVGLDTLSKPSGYIERQVGLWQGQLDYARVRPVPELDTVSRWLKTHLPRDIAAGPGKEQPASIVHGDYKLDNVLFSLDAPPRLLAVVDWEMAALGDPLADLGWLLAFWSEDGTPPPELSILPRLTERQDFPRRREVAERYAQRTEGPLPDLRFYTVLALWKMAILLEAHWARHVRGTAGGFDFSYLDRGGPLFHAYIRSVAEE